MHFHLPRLQEIKKNNKKGLQSRGKRQVTVKEGKDEEEKRRGGGTLLLLGMAITNKERGGKRGICRDDPYKTERLDTRVNYKWGAKSRKLMSGKKL